jgi:hypothetical protein
VLSLVEELRMPSDEWIKTLVDDRRVKFTYRGLPDEGAFIRTRPGLGHVDDLSELNPPVAGRRRFFSKQLGCDP